MLVVIGFSDDGGTTRQAFSRLRQRESVPYANPTRGLRHFNEAVRLAAHAVLALSPDNGDAATFLTAAERALEATPHTDLSQPQIEVTSTQPQSAAGPAPEAERRQLTVMFCDLQGSTALSQQLDPEDLRDVIRSYQEVYAGAVGRFDGHNCKRRSNNVPQRRSPSILLRSEAQRYHPYCALEHVRWLSQLSLEFSPVTIYSGLTGTWTNRHGQLSGKVSHRLHLSLID